MSEIEERLERARAFAQDAIEVGYDHATIGNLYGIRDEIDAIKPLISTLSAEIDRLRADLDAERKRCGLCLEAMWEAAAWAPTETIVEELIIPAIRSADPDSAYVEQQFGAAPPLKAEGE